VILQIGAFFSSLVSGVASGIGQVARAVAPTALDIGSQFLQREINRKTRTRQERRIGTQAVAALNTPGISVARIGGTIQPVGGRVQRATFTPAAFTPAQSPIGNIPLLPVSTFPLDPTAFRQPVQDLVRAVLPARRTTMANGLMRLPGTPGEPKFARDEFGRTIMFVPSPRPGEGFITVNQARQLGFTPTKPFWRFNRKEGQFEKIKARRLNPFNFKATARAGRRVERTLDAVKELVRIERRMSSGKVRLKKRKRRKR